MATVTVRTEGDGLIYHQYGFNYINDKWVFVSFEIWSRPKAPDGQKNRYKFRLENFWNSYNKRESELTEPELPADIRVQALEAIISRITIVTAKEFFK